MLNFSDEPAVQRSGDMADANTPVIPLPNPGEGGPVAPGDDTDTPVIPLPNPGEGGPVYPCLLYTSPQWGTDTKQNPGAV